MMSRLKLGVFGATRGLEYAVNSLADHPYAEVTAICEAYQPLLEKVKGQLPSVNFFSSFDEFLASDIDAVFLCNYANEHAPYAIRALNAGKHVYSEVVPVQNLAEGVALCEAVEKSGKVYAYGENYCYFNQFFEMRIRYERGDIGELVNAEADFINDCSGKWHKITRGDRDHWRNFVPSTFYCTHSIGPMFYATSARAQNVVGMEVPLLPYMADHGARSGSAAMEIMKLTNGAVAKSLNGNLKRQYLTFCRLIGTKGCLQSDTQDSRKLHVYIEGSQQSFFDHEEYIPESYYKNPRIDAMDSFFENGSYHAAEFFLGSIQGDETAKKYSIDVYQGLDMSLPGLLAYHSILSGSQPLEVPDFRDKSKREKYKNDVRCTDPKVATGEMLLPSCESCNANIPDEVYQREAKRFVQSFKSNL